MWKMPLHKELSKSSDEQSETQDFSPTACEVLDPINNHVSDSKEADTPFLKPLVEKRALAKI